MTKEDFLSKMRQIGLDPADHDVGELHAAFLRLSDLFAHLETRKGRSEAQALPVFDPRKPL